MTSTTSASCLLSSAVLTKVFVALLSIFGPAQGLRHSDPAGDLQLLQVDLSAEKEESIWEDDKISLAEGNSFETSAGKLCVEGKHVPQLYVLGAAKTGTTSLADDLMQNNTVPAVPGVNEKEFQFFNPYYNSNTPTNYSMAPARLEAMRQHWLDHMPPCAEESVDAPQVIADYSVDNLRFVPMPSGGLEEGKAVFNDFNLPSVLQNFYQQQNYISELVFVVMIREPLARFQSHWYYGQEWTRKYEDIPKGEFDQELSRQIQQAANEKVYNFRLWASMYGAQLQTWLHRFSASQFMFIPTQSYSASTEDRLTVLNELSARLNTPFQLQRSAPAKRSNPSQHPKLSEDVTPGNAAMFNRFMEKDHQLLLELLAQASLKGAYLGGYTGRPGSTGDIDSWLRAKWNAR
eukprot:TRINITY_DN24189_c0_g2_i1.p1 TRINITY_DN24189_c0_g2~~TRINITY_DN24189_c0_g2_i1.p1  ORF type:complete len:404 (+),score=69.33 TRINITY_DN24189_c0_g2_i1:81-1292(+)